MHSVTVVVKLGVCFIFANLVSAQLNGDFWWLNSKLEKYKAAPSAPQLESLSEFDTDESDKVVFRDNELFNNGVKTKNLKNVKIGNEKVRHEFDFQDRSKIVWPSDGEDKSFVIDKPTYKDPKKKLMLNVDENRKPVHVSEDILEFKFPEHDNSIWMDQIINTSKVSSLATSQKNKVPVKRPSTVMIVNDRIPFKVHEEETPEYENICTYLKKAECNRRSGVFYMKRERGSKKHFGDSQHICCILPISQDEASKIHFKDHRSKRSNKIASLSSSLNQRYALLMRKYGSQVHKPKPTNPGYTKVTNQKIVTHDEDYVDPYANVKISNFQNQYQNRPNRPSTTKYDYGSDDYVEDYIVDTELPKPGLVGLYSDHAGTPPSWTFGSGSTGSYGVVVDEDDDDTSEPSYGYSASIDPRLEDRRVTATKPPRMRRPAKMTTSNTVQSSEEFSYDSDHQTINYQSNPDFQVLNGFKLLNLVSNKSRIYKNGKKTTTTDSVVDEDNENDSRELLIASDFDAEYDDVFDTNQQVFKDCGKTVTQQNYGRDTNIGDAERGSHPWLALVVLTKRRQTILCYATLVHARAAVTAADCVQGRNSCPGEVTLIAGAWDLGDESHEDWQKRMASILLHEQYTPGDLANNLALLHWKRPLKLNANVQPACLTDPHVGDDCKFFGWGGYDQAIRPRSRWQRASILKPRACDERTREPLPSDAFCASVLSRGTVTGAGAPLVCSARGRGAAAGVAVWRDRVVVLAPAHQWVMRSLALLRLH